ncbi:MAG: aminoglycoside phosphotransferase family protein, partial [Chloroflexota bacterium]
MNFHNAINNLIKSSAFIPVLLGEKPKSIRPLAGGTISSVYKAQMADGRSLVLKFGEDADELRHEQLFLEAWAKHGIRTPRVLHHTQLPADLYGGLLLMEYVPGENLLPLIDAGKVDEAKVMIDLGEILATIHDMKASGFGQVSISPDGELRGEHKTLDKSLSTREWEEIIEENRQNNN